MTVQSSDLNRWKLKETSGIIWDITKDAHLPHSDSLEMSGRLVSLIVNYGVNDKGELLLSQHVVWPTLRKKPNDTHASLIKEFSTELKPSIKVNAETPQEKPYSIEFDGILTIRSHMGNQLDLTRTVFPCTDAPTAVQYVTIRNISVEEATVAIDFLDSNSTARGVYGIYVLEVIHTGPNTIVLKSGDSVSFGITFNGRKIADGLEVINVEEEQQKRILFLKSITDSLKLETPIPLLNSAFDFAKIRAAESVFETRSGLLHSPGGLAYYAAVWTNDQAEYAGPFFPFLGEPHAVEASINCYSLYRSFMGPDYTAIPSSIVAEGLDIWEGAGDRGDAAMYAYGAARFVLAMGDRKLAEELFPAIEWCLEYCRLKTTSDGVIASDSDELEGRFPTGNINLSTSSLAYGALCSAADIAYELGDEVKGSEYSSRAAALSHAIEIYFGANVEGYDTYRYYAGNNVLRSWICVPLTMGIMNRKDDTLSALFSPRLWTQDGLATQAGDITFWDRSTLYGFRGAFAAGETARTMKYFLDYSQRRTLGDHVPYAVEAYPEGNQRHLSAESALYCRVFTEGLFGITPTGFRSFTCSPNLPHHWPSMALKSIKAFGNTFDLLVKDSCDNYEIYITSDKNQEQKYICIKGQSVAISLW